MCVLKPFIGLPLCCMCVFRLFYGILSKARMFYRCDNDDDDDDGNINAKLNNNNNNFNLITLFFSLINQVRESKVYLYHFISLSLTHTICKSRSYTKHTLDACYHLLSLSHIAINFFFFFFLSFRSEPLIIIILWWHKVYYPSIRTYIHYLLLLDNQQQQQQQHSIYNTSNQEEEKEDRQKKNLIYKRNLSHTVIL